MPFFKRKSDKQSNPTTPTSPGPSLRSGVIKRTPSNRSQLSDDWPNGDIGSPASLLEGKTSSERRPDTLLLSHDEGDLGKSLQLDSPLRTSSRLSKTFLEILHDKDALPYFIQYMESKDAGHLIRFWLDAESFQAATWTRIRTQSLKSLSKSSVAKSETPVQLSSNSKENATGSASNCSDNIGAISPVISPDSPTTHIAAVPNSTDSEKTVSSCGNPQDESSKHLSHNNNEDKRLASDVAQDHSIGCEENSLTKNSTDIENQNRVEARLSQLISGTSNDSEKSKSESQEEKFKKSIERDAVNIYSKYISLDAVKPIGINEDLRNLTISRLCGEDGCVDPKCFSQCQDFVVEVMDRDYYPDFMRSVFHCKHQIDVLTSGHVYLADVLYNEAAMFYFMESMEQEGASDLLQFVLAADNFQQHLQALSGYDGIQAQTDAMVLYDKYFSLQANTPLGFSDKIRFAVESNICREEGPLPDCFAVPRNIALKSIEKNYFPQFLHSELYYKYLSELVNTIQMTQDFPQKSRKRTESDSASEHSGGSQSTGNESISVKNTLLASDTRQWKKVLHRFEDDLRIDPVLLNPDALWSRPAAGGMSLGKVDTLGQFVSEFEPEPDHEKKKSSGFFKKKREKEKEEEAMALRVAEMIISDVAAATQEAAALSGLSQVNPDRVKPPCGTSAITKGDKCDS